MSYPEHDKLKAVKAESQIIGEFLEWAQSADGGKLVPCERGNDGELYMKYIETNQLLADYFGIDLKLIEQEKNTMLKEQRELNSKNTPLQRAHQRGHDQEGAE